MTERPDYGNWVRNRMIVIPGLIGLAILVVSLLFPPVMLLAVPFLLVAAYFAYARRQFSPIGGDVQHKVHAMLLEHLDWDGQGQVLDIGCGNAALTVRLAKAYPAAQVTGIDYWSEEWGYGQAACEHNAQLEGVADRTTFQHASALVLPFADGQFDAAVSNLVFHEVKDADDKREVIREALRVVKPGGKFAFQDLLMWRQLYGDTDDLVETIKSWGISEVTFVETHNAPFISPLLRLPFMLGTLGIIYGVK